MKEIERKWLVPGLPEEKCRKKRQVETVYLVAEDSIEIRAYRRQKIVEGPTGITYGTPKCFITVKRGNGLTREEYEIAISEAEFFAIRDKVPFRPIHKMWYLYPLQNSLELEVFEVDGAWWYAEIEYPSEEMANTAPLPDFLTWSTEVTSQPEYAMKNYWRRTRIDK